MKMKMEPGFTWIDPIELEKRVSTIPLPKKLKSSFTTVVKRWQSNSGSEWTVGRLKSFKDCLLNSYSIGGREVSHKPLWFRTTPSGRLTGIFGSLWEYAMKGHEHLKSVLFLVNIYTGCVRSELPTQELNKIGNSIERPPVHLPRRSHVETKPAQNWAYKATLKLGLHRKIRVKRKPVPVTLVLPGKASHVAKLPDHLLACSGLPLLSHGPQRLLQEAAGSWVMPGGNIYTLADVGDIHLTHEPGLKTRYFASPNLIVQRALEPLKDSLLDLLNRIPWDCTKNQRKADKVILSTLNLGRMVHSVDLSSATDAFPWEWQRAVLDNLLVGKEARKGLGLLIAVVEQGYWNLPDGSQVRFSAGQPLGLGPSFPAFTLAHGILLYALNGYKWNEDFFVLGDDIIILDDALHERYRKVLQGWAVEISEAKSFSSSNIAQFAGVTYTQTGAFWVPKWRPLTEDSLLDLAAWWYPGLTKGFKDHSLIERVLSLPIPWGIGRNPKGLPLSERLSPEVIQVILDREERRDTAPKGSATREDSVALWAACEKHGRKYSESTRLIVDQMIKEGHSLREAAILDALFQAPTRASLHPSLTMLMHGTEVAGYPSIRYKDGRVDPYSLGRLKSWKQAFKRVETRDRKSVV